MGAGTETIQLVLGMLAVARLSRLLVVDEIAAGLRRAALRRLDPDRPLDLKVAYLIYCQWCQSIWVGAAVMPLAVMFPGSMPLRIALSVLAASQIAGILGDVRVRLRAPKESADRS